MKKLVKRRISTRNGRMRGKRIKKKKKSRKRRPIDCEGKISSNNSKKRKITSQKKTLVEKREARRRILRELNKNDDVKRK